jgi:glycosyltransferase involved in cell wall biosynthesis
MPPPIDLLLIMPVFNEQASVRKVVIEWFQEVENWTENFAFLAINDGSKDGTLHILQRLREQLGHRFEILDRENRGHGQSCLQGYRTACERGIPYVFQIDSDGQCDPQYFFRFWRDREKYGVIYGHRTRRDDGWRRVVASAILRMTLLLFARANCVDANVPYRLMKTEGLKDVLDRIPSDFFLANVGLAVVLRRAGWKEGIVPIRFRERYGGEPMFGLNRFGVKGWELLKQLHSL